MTCAPGRVHLATALPFIALLIVALPLQSEAAITIDGQRDDWSETSPATFGVYHASMLVGNEFAWSDPQFDERTDLSSPADARCDLRELRITADTDFLYFLAHFTNLEIASGNGMTQLHIAVDTDRVAGSGKDYFSKDIQTAVDNNARWEFEICTEFGSGQETVAVHDRNYNRIGSAQDSAVVNTATNLMEFRVRISELVAWPATLRFSVVVNRSDASDNKVNIAGGSDVIDCVTDFGGTDHQATWNEVADGACNYYFDITFETGGRIVSNATRFNVEPYLQLPGRNAMTICFELDQPDTALVEYGLTGALGSPVVAPELKRFHHVTLTGLDAQETYYYRVTVAGFSSTITDFRTRVHDTANFTFASMSDPQAGPPTHDPIVNLVADSSPKTLLLCPGDLSGDGRYYSNWRNQFFSPAMQNLMKNIPMVAVYGNHEQSGSGAEYDTGATNHFNNYFRLPQEPALPNNNQFFHSFDYGGIHFSLVNTNAPFTPDTLQYEWLIDDLRRNDTATWRIVVFHHSPITSGTHKYNVNTVAARDYLVPVFETYDVKWVITGHEHFYERSRKDGVNYVDASSASYLRDINVNSNSYQARAEKTYCYALYDVDNVNKTIALRAYRQDGTLIESFTDTATSSYTGAPTKTADGILADWHANELMESESNDTVYISMDDTYIYIAYESRNWNSADGGTGDGFIYFDTNPGSGPGATVSVDWNGTHNFGPNFRPGAAFCIEDANYTNGRRWNGAGWDVDAFTPHGQYIGNSSRDVTELIFTKAQLGLSPGDSLAVAIWAKWESKKNIFASFPRENASSGNEVTELIENHYLFPSIESGAVRPRSRVIDRFVLTATTPVNRNAPCTVTVVALNDLGETITSYHSTQYTFSLSSGSVGHTVETFVAGFMTDTVTLDAGGQVTLTFRDNHSGKSASQEVYVNSPIAIDGDPSEWPATTLIGTESNDTFYFTFDDTFIYICWTSRTWLTADGFFYFDTNPFSGLGAYRSVSWNGRHDFGPDFMPDMVFCIEDNTYTNGRAWNGVDDWTPNAFTADAQYIGNAGTDVTEIKISKATLGIDTNDSFALIAFVKWEADPHIFIHFPLQNPSPILNRAEFINNSLYYERTDSSVSPRTAVLTKFELVMPSEVSQMETFAITVVGRNENGETVRGYNSRSYTLEISSGTLNWTGGKDTFVQGAMTESVSINGAGLITVTFTDTESGISCTGTIAVGIVAVFLDSPDSGIDTSVSPITLSGRAERAFAGDTVQVFVNSSNVETVYLSASETWVATNVPVTGIGETIFVRVTNRYDTYGLSAPITVNFNDSPVVMAITAPPTNTDTNVGWITVSGTASNLAVGDQILLYLNSHCDTWDFTGTVAADSTWSFNGLEPSGVGDTIFVAGTNRYGVTGISESIVINYHYTSRLVIRDTRTPLVAGEMDSLLIVALSAAGETNIFDTRIVHFHVRSSDSIVFSSDTVALESGTAWISFRDSAIGDWYLDATDSAGVVTGARFHYSIVPVTATVTCTVILEARGNHSGCSGLLYNGVDTYTAVSNESGAIVFTVVLVGVYTFTGKETSHLRRTVTGIAITGSDTSVTIGNLVAGDANDDNQIDIFDAAIVKYYMTAGSGPRGDIDGDSDVDAADLGWIRRNFGRRGD